MNPYAANFQVPAPSPAALATATGTTTSGTAAAVVGLADEGNDHEAAWAEGPSQNGDGAGGYWDEHGQHHPGYGGDDDPAVYHPDGYDPTYHQVTLCVLCCGVPQSESSSDLECKSKWWGLASLCSGCSLARFFFRDGRKKRNNCDFMISFSNNYDVHGTVVAPFRSGRLGGGGCGDRCCARPLPFIYTATPF